MWSFIGGHMNRKKMEGRILNSAILIGFLAFLWFLWVISDFYTPLINYVYLLVFAVIIIYASARFEKLEKLFKKYYYEILAISVILFLGILVGIYSK